MVLSQFGFTTSVYLQKTIKFIISSSFSGCATLLTLLCERRKRLDVLRSFALVIFFVCFTSEQVNLPLVRFTEFMKNLIGKLSLHYINKLYNLEPLCSLVSALKYSHLHIFACVNVRRVQRAGLSGRKPIHVL